MWTPKKKKKGFENFKTYINKDVYMNNLNCLALQCILSLTSKLF